MELGDYVTIKMNEILYNSVGIFNHQIL